MSERVLMIGDDAALARMLAEYLVRPERSGPEYLDSALVYLSDIFTGF